MSILNNLHRIIKIVLLSITIVVAVLFLLGNLNPMTVLYNNVEHTVSSNIGLLMIWTYIMIGIALVTIFALIVRKFAKSASYNPKNIIKPLCILGGGVLIFVIAYALGDNTPLRLHAEVAANQAPWLRIADMFLYINYLAFAALVVTIIYSGVRQSFK